MHDGNLMVHGKNEEHTAKPASRAALLSFILRISLESPRAALIEPSSSTIETRAALTTTPLFLTLGYGLVIGRVIGAVRFAVRPHALLGAATGLVAQFRRGLCD